MATEEEVLALMADNAERIGKLHDRKMALDPVQLLAQQLDVLVNMLFSDEGRIEFAYECALRLSTHLDACEKQADQVETARQLVRPEGAGKLIVPGFRP